MFPPEWRFFDNAMVVETEDGPVIWGGGEGGLDAGGRKEGGEGMAYCCC